MAKNDNTIHGSIFHEGHTFNAGSEAAFEKHANARLPKDSLDRLRSQGTITGFDGVGVGRLKDGKPDYASAPAPKAGEIDPSERQKRADYEGERQVFEGDAGAGVNLETGEGPTPDEAEEADRAAADEAAPDEAKATRRAPRRRKK